MSSSASSVADLLRSGSQKLDAAGSETPRLDAELLLGHVLGVGRATLLAEGGSRVSAGQQEALAALIERRASGVPVAYLRGLKEFHGLALSVDERALIPRPETELLVDLALGVIGQRLTDAPRDPGVRPLLAWDVGTGSGAIAVALAAECRHRGYGGDVTLRATDISTDALALAMENAVAHGVAGSIEFAQADLTEIPDTVAADLVLANLPYIPTGVVPTLPIAASFEPQLALDGGADGLAIIRRLLAQLPQALVADGVALLEIGSDQADPVRAAAAETLPGWSVDVHDDLAGRPRVAELTRGGAA
ncbi:MAG: peptide chain release factor N(5)-glutamine methyltransferase [Chloroflexota bacterium]